MVVIEQLFITCGCATMLLEGRAQGDSLYVVVERCSPDNALPHATRLSYIRKAIIYIRYSAVI